MGPLSRLTWTLTTQGVGPRRGPLLAKGIAWGWPDEGVRDGRKRVSRPGH